MNKFNRKTAIKILQIAQLEKLSIKTKVRLLEQVIAEIEEHTYNSYVDDKIAEIQLSNIEEYIKKDE